jgi:hypothetical protein
MLLATIAFSALAAVLASRAHARIVVAQPAVVTYLSHGIVVDPSLLARPTRNRRLVPRVPLHASVHSNSNRLFVWPAHGTSTYKRAARMALHGDPEAQSFVSGRSDVNPFDAQ